MAKTHWYEFEHPQSILLIADPHLSQASQPEEQRWWPRICYFLARLPNPLGPELAHRWLSSYDQMTQERLRRVLYNARRHGHYEYLISLGDHTQGIKAAGMTTQHAIYEFKAFTAMLKEYFPGTHKAFVWGDHDVGYRPPKSSWWSRLTHPFGGLSAESVKTAEKLLGPPFFRVKLGNWSMIFLNSEIIDGVHTASYPPVLRRRLSKLAARQQKFLLAELKHAENAILFIHKPEAALAEIFPKIKAYQSKVKATFVGHWHSKVIGELLKLEHSMARDFNLQVVPATWGVEGFGGGFMVLTLFSDHLRVKTYNL